MRILFILSIMTVLNMRAQGHAELEIYPASDLETCNGRAIILGMEHCQAGAVYLSWQLPDEKVLSADSVLGLCAGDQRLCIMDELGREATLDFYLDWDEDIYTTDIYWYCEGSTLYMSDIDLVSTVTHADTRDTLPGVELEITRNGRFFTRLISPVQGTFSTLLPLGYDYMLEYRAEGYYTKTIQLDARDASITDSYGGYAASPSVAMIPLREGLALPILDEPIGIMTYSADRDCFEFDFDYTRLRREQVKELLEQSK